MFVSLLRYLLRMGNYFISALRPHGMLSLLSLVCLTRAMDTAVFLSGLIKVMAHPATDPLLSSRPIVLHYGLRSNSSILVPFSPDTHDFVIN